MCSRRAQGSSSASGNPSTNRLATAYDASRLPRGETRRRPLTDRNSLPTEFGFEIRRGSYAGRELRSIASLASRENGAGCHAHRPRVLRAGWERSARLARVLLFRIDIIRVQSTAGRGGTGLTSIRQGLPGPTPRICSVRGSGFDSRPSGRESSETSRRPLSPSDDLFALRKQRVGGFRESQPRVGAEGCVRPEWTSPAFAATRCRFCRSRARPGGTGSCDRCRGSSQREPCCRP